MEQGHYPEDLKGSSDLRYSLISTNSVTVDTYTLSLKGSESIFDGLTEVKIWAYGMGHFFNDLAGACWFNFLFYYLKRVVRTPAAATMMVVGQVVDGIATPAIGYLSDKFQTRFGQRTPWYVGGLIIFLISFIALYQNFQSANKTYEYIYYSFVSAFVNIGWAGVQIGHMSLVPLLTCSRKRRDRLNNLRNTFTFIANFFALGLGLIVFKFMSDPPLEYKIISYILAGLGLSASIFFLMNINYLKLSKVCSEKSQKIRSYYNLQLYYQPLSQYQDQDQPHSIKQWFKTPAFYLFGICYMGVRLCTNMFGTLLPFYLVGVVKMGGQTSDQQIVPFNVALVPLVVYLSSVGSSSILDQFYATFGRKAALGVGTIVCTLALAALFGVDENNSWVVYLVAFFVGVSQPMVLSTGVNFISDVVGSKGKSGAFVFGVYSLLDKFSAGVVIYFIGNSPAYTKDPADLTHSEKNFIKFTLILIPALSAILAALIVLGTPVKYYRKKQVDYHEEHQKINSIRDYFVQ